MRLKETVKGWFEDLFEVVEEPMEPVYSFEFTERELEDLKESLWESGLEYCRNRALYKKLCEAVCDSYDKNVLRNYE